MNVYEKLQKARVDLQGKKIKKSGKNTFAKYDYYELADFMPAVNSIFSDLKLFSKVNFVGTAATLTIIDTEKPEQTIEFSSPWVEATVKGAQPIQNLGACETYQRRYLYMMALEITESDAMDSAEPVKASQPTKEVPPKHDTKKDVLSRAWRNAKVAEMKPEQVALVIEWKFGQGATSESITEDQARSLETNVVRWWKQLTAEEDKKLEESLQ